jgi:hypothetical protein
LEGFNRNPKHGNILLVFYTHIYIVNISRSVGGEDKKGGRKKERKKIRQKGGKTRKVKKNSKLHKRLTYCIPVCKGAT